MLGIDLTRMECKGDYIIRYREESESIDLTRMECKVTINKNGCNPCSGYRFNQNGM